MSQWISTQCECCLRPDSAFIIAGAKMPQGSSRGKAYIPNRIRCNECRAACEPTGKKCNIK